MHQVLPRLPALALGQEVAGRAAVARRGQQVFHQLREWWHRPGLGPDRGEERAFQGLPEPEQPGVPLPAGVDPGQTAVVQFVAEVERELMVLAPGVTAPGRPRTGAPWTAGPVGRAGGDQLHHRRGERAPGEPRQLPHRPFLPAADRRAARVRLRTASPRARAPATIRPCCLIPATSSRRPPAPYARSGPAPTDPHPPHRPPARSAGGAGGAGGAAVTAAGRRGGRTRRWHRSVRERAGRPAGDGRVRSGCPAPAP